MILSSLITLSTYAQSETNKLNHLKLQRGIYFSFKQITTNFPSFTDSFNIKERTNGNLAMLCGGKYTFEFTDKKKSEYKEVKREFVGISDGENFYISDRFTVNGWQGMTLCLLSGPYIIADIQGSTGQYTGGGIIPSMVKIGNGFLIDIRNGTSVPLTEKELKKLLTKYPHILNKYKDKENMAEFSNQIINEINVEAQ